MSEGEPPPPSDADRAGRAHAWIRELTAFPDRFAGSFGEREAATRIGEWMRELGVRDVALERFGTRADGSWNLALHGALALLALALGGLSGLVVAGVAAWSFDSEHRLRVPRLGRLLFRGESVNVVGRAGASVPARRVVITAHLDTAHAGLIFSPEVAGWFARLAKESGGGPPRMGPQTLPHWLLLGAVGIAAVGWMGAGGFVFSLLELAVVVGLLLLIAANVQWALAPSTPGANDNASAVAAALLCAERLLPALPDDTELVLVGTGSEEVGCVGMQALLDGHRELATESTLFVNFECVGGGRLHFIRSEGTLRRTQYPEALLERAQALVRSGEFPDVTPTDLLSATDGHVPALRGLPTLSVITLEDSGVPRHYHQAQDTVDGVDLALVVRAADFAAAVARSALADG